MKIINAFYCKKEIIACYCRIVENLLPWLKDTLWLRDWQWALTPIRDPSLVALSFPVGPDTSFCHLSHQATRRGRQERGILTWTALSLGSLLVLVHLWLPSGTRPWQPANQYMPGKYFMFMARGFIPSSRGTSFPRLGTSFYPLSCTRRDQMGANKGIR